MIRTDGPDKSDGVKNELEVAAEERTESVTLGHLLDNLCTLNNMFIMITT